LRDDRHRSGRKTLAQRAKSGDLEVKRQATWRMSVLLDLAKRSPRSRLADFRASCPNALQQAVNFLLSRAAHRRANADICGAVVS